MLSQQKVRRQPRGEAQGTHGATHVRAGAASATSPRHCADVAVRNGPCCPTRPTRKAAAALLCVRSCARRDSSSRPSRPASRGKRKRRFPPAPPSSAAFTSKGYARTCQTAWPFIFRSIAMMQCNPWFRVRLVRPAPTQQRSRRAACTTGLVWSSWAAPLAGAASLARRRSRRPRHRPGNYFGCSSQRPVPHALSAGRTGFTPRPATAPLSWHPTINYYY